MVGCSATTNRCGRPPPGAASWYLATRPLTASASSPANAARSLADAKRTSLSMPSVASGLPAALAHQAPGDGEQPARGALIRLARRIRCDGGQRGRRDHVRGGGRLEHALGAVAPAALLDELDQTMPLQCAQVVVRLLAAEPHTGGERARRTGGGQLGEQARADRIQRRLGGGGALDDGDV